MSKISVDAFLMLAKQPESGTPLIKAEQLIGDHLRPCGLDNQKQLTALQELDTALYMAAQRQPAAAPVLSIVREFIAVQTRRLEEV